ncbi:MAG: tRNA (adenosine(37)-N6)-threonylcarbamoyltransferase complex dimerization subunit type 1 TsaB [Saccharofermentans sp.]|jgi:tRNA threonylcarbamoyladenosine biosynthesis protein TsaB|nr:tRNA (adenosine(37)-N6)-threonylcarbamoyltransferase complex dimerization subunit type 1 TsaB [Saccharofermentans sp.]
MKILVCDTSNQNASAGIYEDGRVIAYELSFETRTHSETFMPLVHRVMEQAGLSHSELDAYAVTVGPGSFTGIRIGLAAVKGMALAAGKPCIAVSSTEALARSCENATATSGEETLMVPAIDARNNRVFARVLEDDTLKTLIAENAYDADDLALKIKNMPEVVYGTRRQVIVVGSGAEVLKNAFEKNKIHINLYCAKGIAITPKGVAEAAFAHPELISARDVKATYCAVSQAERLRKNDAKEEYKIRPATLEDVGRIMVLEEEGIPHPWQKNEIEKLITEDNKCAFVTEKNGHLACYIGCDIVLDECNIGNLVTEEEERGKGLATAILKRLLEYLKDRGIKHVYLEVESTNLAAISVYKKCGFRSYNIRKDYFGTNRDAILMDCEI